MRLGVLCDYISFVCYAIYLISYYHTSYVRTTIHVHIRLCRTFFPSGWVWSQAVAPGNAASLSLIGGRFSIGPLSPLNFVVYYRCRPNANLTSTTAPDGGFAHSDDDIRIFRSTDLDQFQYRLDGVSGEARVTATNLCNTRKIVIHIKSIMPVYDAGFRFPIHIPTAQGFSNEPGCKETYTGMYT